MLTYKTPVPWARLRFVAETFARVRLPQSPPVLVISLPRSGSSWAGEILGAAPNALYLREPVTQTHLASGGKAAVTPVCHDQPPCGYSRAAEYAFHGIPAFRRGIVQIPEQWVWSRRTSRRVVIKEVNPLALSWFRERYYPAIVYLIRHPVAVADSYRRLGWMDIDPRERLSYAVRAGCLPELEGLELEGFWERMGAFQAAVTRLALAGLEWGDDCHLIYYEDLCNDPVSSFRRLYDSLGLEWDDAVRKRIEKRMNPDGKQANDDGRDNPYSTQRDTANMQDAWRRNVSPEDADAVMSTYRNFGLDYYLDD